MQKKINFLSVTFALMLIFTSCDNGLVPEENELVDPTNHVAIHYNSSNALDGLKKYKTEDNLNVLPTGFESRVQIFVYSVETGDLVESSVSYDDNLKLINSVSFYLVDGDYNVLVVEDVFYRSRNIEFHKVVNSEKWETVKVVDCGYPEEIVKITFDAYRNNILNFCSKATASFTVAGSSESVKIEMKPDGKILIVEFFTNNWEHKDDNDRYYIYDLAYGPLNAEPGIDTDYPYSGGFYSFGNKYYIPASRVDASMLIGWSDNTASRYEYVMVPEMQNCTLRLGKILGSDRFGFNWSDHECIEGATVNVNMSQWNQFLVKVDLDNATINVSQF